MRAFFARIDVSVTPNFSDAEKQSSQLNTYTPNAVDGERREGNWSENCTQTVSVLSIEASDRRYFLTGSGKYVSTSYCIESSFLCPYWSDSPTLLVEH